MNNTKDIQGLKIRCTKGTEKSFPIALFRLGDVDLLSRHTLDDNK